MKNITKIGLAALGAAGAWSLLLRPRQNQPGWDRLGAAKYAHRGLHDAALGIPENSMAAFRRAVEHGFGAELDIHLMADGELAVVQDSNLKRVCGADVCIEDLTAADLPNYPLMGTEETIPLFRDVLALFEGKTPLVVELKVERGNTNALTDAAMAALAGCLVLCVQGIALDDALFETLSAIGTVGLSRGLTSTLPLLSQWVILLLMFAGRVGSMSVAMAITKDRPQPKLRNVPEKILIG